MRRIVTLLLVLTLGACSAPASSTGTTISPTTTSTTVPGTTTTSRPGDFAVISPAFEPGRPIPAQHSCEGPDISPELVVVGLPKGTNAVAIIVDDPDAPLGTWDHWVEFDIPASPGSLDIPRDAAASIGVPGVNSWKLEGYMGPCPPEGEEHVYHFIVYALDGFLGLPAGVDSTTVRSAMEGHVVDSADLTGTYAR